MKFYKYIPIVALSMATLTGITPYAQAQTANMTADVVVENSVTLATPAQLNFGMITAVRDTAQTATVTVDTAGSPSVATGGGTAITAILDAASVSAGQVTVADSADGVTLNVEINNVVDPVNGGESFVLDQFTTSWNGGVAANRTISTPWTETFDSAFGGGTNTLDIGATITTTSGSSAAYTDGTYSGTYDVVFSY
ncbi:MAG TPA: hypothetical protein PLF01_03930 [Alphaproteobacteria bacterium]|nr:hypothetical protein [Alphaproteobacteria bacterium]